MKQKREAKRYANALLRNVGVEKAPQIIAEINAVNELMVKSKEFRSLLVSPLFSKDEREKVIKQIAEKIKLSENTVKFIMYLSEVNVIAYLSDIIRIAINLYLEKKKKAKAVVITPIEISKDYEIS